MIDSIKTFVLALMLIVWGGTALRSFEFYTTTIKNRFRFRYWFSIAIANLFIVTIALVQVNYNTPELSAFRWNMFLLMDILLLEIFVTSIKRPLELFVRPWYYINLLIAYSFGNDWFIIINSFLLVILARRSPYTKTYRHFTITFILYALVALVPMYFGYGTLASFSIGAMYTIHLAWGVRKLYFEEKVADHMLGIEHEDILTHKHEHEK